MNINTHYSPHPHQNPLIIEDFLTIYHEHLNRLTQGTLRQNLSAAFANLNDPELLISLKNLFIEFAKTGPDPVNDFFWGIFNDEMSPHIEKLIQSEVIHKEILVFLYCFNPIDLDNFRPASTQTTQTPKNETLFWNSLNPNRLEEYQIFFSLNGLGEKFKPILDHLNGLKELVNKNPSHEEMMNGSQYLKYPRLVSKFLCHFNDPDKRSQWLLNPHVMDHFTESLMSSQKFYIQSLREGEEYVVALLKTYFFAQPRSEDTFYEILKILGNTNLSLYKNFRFSEQLLQQIKGGYFEICPNLGQAQIYLEKMRSCNQSLHPIIRLYQERYTSEEFIHLLNTKSYNAARLVECFFGFVLEINTHITEGLANKNHTLLAKLLHDLRKILNNKELDAVVDEFFGKICYINEDNILTLPVSVKLSRPHPTYKALPQLEENQISKAALTNSRAIETPPLADTTNLNSFEIPSLENFLKTSENLAFFLKIYKELEDYWFKNEEFARFMMHQLIGNQLVWSFEATDSFLTPLYKLIQNMDKKRNACLAFLAEYLRLFPISNISIPNDEVILQNYLKNQKGDAREVLQALISYANQRKVSPSIQQKCSPELSRELAYSFFCVKWQEIKAKIHQIQNGKSHHQPCSKNCYILAQDINRARVFTLEAFFNENKELIALGTSAKSYPLLLQIIKKEAVPQDYPETCLLEPQDLTLLKNHEDESVIIFQRIKPPLKLMGNFSGKSDHSPYPLEGHSNALPQNPQPITHNSKKRKIEINQAPLPNNSSVIDLTLPGHSSNTKNTQATSISSKKGNIHSVGYQEQGHYKFVTEENNPSPFKKQKVDQPSSNQLNIPIVQTPLASNFILGKSFWNDLSNNAIETIYVKVNRQQELYQLLVKNERQNFPIVEKLAQLKPLENFECFNPLLLEYQQEAVKELLAGFQLNLKEHGGPLSKILSLKMGLGKTYVILETVSQHINLGAEGPILIVVPANLQEQMHLESLRYLSEVKIHALRHLLQSDLGIDLVQAFIDKFSIDFSNLLKQSQKEANLHALSESSKEDLKSTLRQYALLRKKNLYQHKTTLSEIFTPQLKKLITLHWSTLQEKLKSHPEKRLTLEKEIEKLFQEDLKGYPGFDPKIKNLSIDELFLKLPPQLLMSNCEKLLYALGLILDINPDRKETKPSSRPGELLKLFLYPSPRKLEEVTENDLSQKYVGIIKNTSINKALHLPEASLRKINLAIIDEAHNFNNIGNETTKEMQRFLNLIEKKILVTATPITNHYLELCHLIEMVNPGAFLKGSIDALNKLVSDLAKVIVDSESDEEHIEELALKSFAHFHHLNSILKKMIISMDSDHPLVVKNWQGRIPTFDYTQYPVNVVHKEIFDAITQNFKSGQYQQADFEDLTKKALVHTSLKNYKGGEFDKAVKNLQKLSTPDLLKNTSMFLPFSKDIETGNYVNADFDRCIKEKLKAIIIVDYIAAAEIGYKIVNSYGDAECLIFSGELKANKKNEVIKAFKEKGPKAKVLFLMIKAGGVGLNLPEADIVFGLCKTYSPTAWEQAYYRAIRVGNVGHKKIVEFQYNIFFSHHVDIIKDKKEKLSAFTLKNLSIEEEFTTWLAIAQLTAKQAEINQSKNLELSQEKFAEIDRKIEKLKRIEKEKIRQIIPSEDRSAKALPVVEESQIVVETNIISQNTESMEIWEEECISEGTI